MPDHAIIDAHVHLVDPEHISYPWLASVPALDRSWSVADFTSASEGLGVEGMIFVEVDAAPEMAANEAAFISSLAKHEPRLMGIVASVPMDQGQATEPLLAEMVKKTPLLRGVRHLIQKHIDSPGWACRPMMIEGVRSLARRNLVFELCLFHPQLPDAMALVRACPEVTFVLDHIGKPGIAAGLMTPWRDNLASLAALPNVVCKISGVVTEADHTGWTENQIAPYVTHALNVFGGDRVLFGGDWPVSTLATDYARWVRLVEGCAAPFGATFQAGLWSGNARRIYQL